MARTFLVKIATNDAMVSAAKNRPRQENGELCERVSCIAAPAARPSPHALHLHIAHSFLSRKVPCNLRLPVMVKGKIQVLAGGVITGRGSKPVQVALSERSTAREVVSVILKKYGLEDDPFDYQVWVVCPPQPGKSNVVTLYV